MYRVLAQHMKEAAISVRVIIKNDLAVQSFAVPEVIFQVYR